MIISITGPAGSGKSTIAQKLADELGWPRYYIGGLRRQKAKEKGLTLAEYNRLGETDPSTDLEVDRYQEELGRKKDNFIIEGRTSWHFIPHSVKLYLDVDERTGAERVFKQLKENNQRNEDRELKSAGEVLSSHRQRRQSDDRRYKKYFNIEVYRPKNFDLVIDTTNKTQDQVFAEVFGYIRELMDKKAKTKN